MPKPKPLPNPTENDFADIGSPLSKIIEHAPADVGLTLTKLTPAESSPQNNALFLGGLAGAVLGFAAMVMSGHLEINFNSSKETK